MSASPLTQPLFLSYTAQACNTCHQIHPTHTNPPIAICICETTVFCNAKCKNSNSDHKEACKMIREILDEPILSSLRFIPSTNDPTQLSSRRMLWRNRLLMIKQLVTVKALMNPDVSTAVRNRFSMEPFCCVCYATMRNGSEGGCIKPRCKRCFMAFACDLHEGKVKKMHTTEECDNYGALHMTQDYLRDYVNRFGKDFIFVPDGNMGIKPKKDDWTSFMKVRVSKTVKKEMITEPALYFAITRSLSVQMTTVFALKQFKINIGRRLVVHILGASTSDGMPSPVWEELMHQYRNIEELYIVLIGPDLKMMINHTARDIDFPSAVCEHCVGKKRIYRVVGGLYHDFMEMDAYSKPDIAMAFNTGLSEDFRSSWEPTLKHLISKDIPTCLTSFASYEAEADENIVKEWGGRVLGGFKKNPYRSLEPMVDADVLAKDKFFYYSHFYILVKGRR